MNETLTYVWHDCFIYRSGSCIIVFDYWRERDSRFDREPSFLPMLRESGLPVYVLVSHHHKDHFNRNIFAWAAEVPDIHYIISKDTARSVNYLLKSGSTYRGPLRVDADKVTVMRPGDEFRDGRIYVHAFASTDTGNSYAVETGGKRLFHAGDLNVWMWKDESTPAEVAAAIRDFEVILDDIHRYYREFDVVMFPVDARIGRDWWEGAFRLLHTTYVENFVPMHFCLYEDYDQRKQYERAATAFARYADPTQGHCCVLTIPGQPLLL